MNGLEDLQWALEKLFYYLVTDKFILIPKILELTNREYIRMIQRLSADEKRNLFCIEAVLNYAHQRDWIQCKRNLEGAKLQYMDVLLPYWKQEKEQQEKYQDMQLKAKAMPKRLVTSLTASKPASSYKLNTSDVQHKSLKHRLFAKSSQSDTVSLSTKHSLDSGPIEENGNNVSERMSLDDQGNSDQTETVANKIAEAFNNIFEKEWKEAFAEIKKLQSGKQSHLKEREVIKCLREIVLKCFSTTKEEACKQIQLMEQACLSIMSKGDLKNASDMTLKETNFTEYLLEYRKHMADITVSRIQNIFVFSYLDKILDKYSLKRISKSAISTYSKRCVELTWWMNVQCPPIHMLTGEENGLFDDNLYRHYKKSGAFNVVEFIVWPALLFKENGRVISKGVAQ